MQPIHDLSILNLAKNADPVVQAVMAGLLLASIACWALILEKFIRMRGLRREARVLAEAATEGGFAPDNGQGVVAAIRIAAEAEAMEGGDPEEDRNDIRSRLERAMRGALKRELQRIEAGLPFLATTGSAAPFVGLFGTVWGIMNSFTSIAQQKDTSLAVVAPGIAEALFATALGLVAAIPAVIAYNQFAVGLGRSADTMGASIALLAKRLSRRTPKPSAAEPMRKAL